MIIIYARVSTEEQGRSGYSLAEQLRACRSAAATLAPGQPIVEFVDEMSGELLERPGLQRALDLVRTGQVTYFVCLDPDRLARKLMVQLLVTDEIERKGCKLEFVSSSYAASPEGRLFYQLRGAISEFEKAKIIERMMRGKRGKVASGGIPARINLYGYTLLAGLGRAPAHSVLVPNPNEAAWVQTMFNWIASEHIGPVQIAKRLTALGVPTKNQRNRWDPTVVRRILTNPVYATGRLEYGKRDCRGLGALAKLSQQERQAKGIRLTPRRKLQSEFWGTLQLEPLIPVELWEQAQLILATFRQGRRAQDPRLQARMLTGLGRCGVCGRPLCYYGATKIACTSVYRHLQGRDPGQRTCHLPQKDRTRVEEAVWRQVAEWLQDPELLSTAHAHTDEANRIGQGEQEEQAVLTNLLEAKRDAQRRIGLLYAQGLWPDSTALPELDRIAREIRALEARLNELGPPTTTAPQPAPLHALLQDPNWREHVQKRLSSASYEEKTELVRLVVARYVLHPTGRGEPAKVDVIPRL